MKRNPWFTHPILVLLLFGSLGAAPAAAADAAKVTVNWDKVVRVSKTTATLQVVVNPPLRRGSAIHDRVFQVLRDLRADYVRYVPWLPYPKLGVAELDPPRSGRTSWDFSLIDPLAIDFFEATAGHPVIIN
ncbi:MAG: glycosyl hydrolase family 39, partial [Acidobacteria bacterium]